MKLDGLVSSFLGTTARNIGNLFAFANRHRCILLLDEFDAIAKVRDDPQEVGEIKRVVNALLQNLDTRRDVGFTIGITNHPKLRPGDTCPNCESTKTQKRGYRFTRYFRIQRNQCQSCGTWFETSRSKIK